MPARLRVQQACLAWRQEALGLAREARRQARQIDAYDLHHFPAWRAKERQRVPVTLLIIAALLVGRMVLARRPVLVAWRALIAPAGAAALFDLTLASSNGRTTAALLVMVLLLTALYLAGGGGALVFRASRDEVRDALRRSARMLRLELEGGPRRYEITSIEPPATVTVSSPAKQLHHLVFRGVSERPKGKLFRSVLSKQFGRLVPIIIRVRS